MSTSPETAVQLSGTSITGNNSGYPDYTFGSYTLRQAYWFKWTPSYGSENVTFDATGSSFTSRLWVFIDDGDGNLVLYGNAEGSILLPNTIQTYYIVVAGLQDYDFGPFELLFPDQNLKIGPPEEKLPVNFSFLRETRTLDIYKYGFYCRINISRAFGGPPPYLSGAIAAASEYILNGGDMSGTGSSILFWSPTGSGSSWDGGPGQLPAVNTGASLRFPGSNFVGQYGRHFASQGTSFPSLYPSQMTYQLDVLSLRINIPYVVTDEDNTVPIGNTPGLDWYDYNVWDPSALNENPIDDNFRDPNYYARYGTNNVFTPRIPAEFISAQIKFVNVIEYGSFPGATVTLGVQNSNLQGSPIQSYFSETEIIHQGSIYENLTINLSKNQVINSLYGGGGLFSVNIIDSDTWAGNFTAVPDGLPTYDSPGEYETFKKLGLGAELTLYFKSPSFWYYYTVPLTAPPLRLAQRDDQLLGSARLDMTGSSTSEQSSIRLLGKGTYL